MPPRRRSKAPAAVELPEPLWAMIASHLSIKDWAKVSGTCKTTFGVQPRTIDIRPLTPPAGVTWASKRMGSVEVLCLRPNGALGLANTGVQDLNTLMSLRQLEIMAPSGEDTTTAFKMWFAWLLSRAQKLTLLSTWVGRLEWFPPMMQLRHLVLKCNQNPGKTFAALPHAKCLQTLSLHAGRLSGGAMVLDAPRLELRSLPELRAVALHGVCPDHTLLPKECGLHLAGLVTLDTLGDEEWSSVLANLRSLDHVNNTPSLPQLPGLIGNVDLQNLSIVAIQFEKCGDADAPMALTNLAHVQQLSVVAEQGMYIIVPAKVAWQKLVLWGIERLEVTFKKINGFATTVNSGVFSSRNFAGPCLFRLCQILAQRGTPCTSFSHEGGGTTLAFPDMNAGRISDCFCGACMKCLRASGVAEACSSVPLEDEADASGGESSDEDEDQDEDEEDQGDSSEDDDD